MKNFELKGWLAAGVSLAAALGLALSVMLLASGGGIEALGVTNFDTLQIEDGSASSPSLSFTSDGDTGFYRIGANNMGWSQGGTLAFDINSGGTIDFTSSINQTLVNAASGSANPYDYTGTLGIMNGSDDFTLFDANITNADHTGTGNTVQALDVAGITADAHATESAIKLGAGWDSDLNFITSGEIAVDDTVMVTVKDPPAADAGATTEFFEVAATTPIDTAGSNTHNFITVDAAIGNSSGGTNVVSGVQIDGITGDAQVTEYGINIGAGWDTALNIAGGGATVVGTFAVDASEIGAAEIANIARTVSIGLMEFIECTTDAGADINYTDGADAFPDFINSTTDGTGFTLTFDDTGGQIDTAYICANLAVPADYASGGSFVVRTTKDAETGANTEVINCAGSINGAALGVAGTVTVAINTTTAYTCTPTLTALAAGDSLSFELHITSGGTVDDKVNMHSVEFRYTATQ